MAKRKRLTPANPDYLPEGLETKAMIPRYKDGWAGTRTASAPISAVAGDAAATAALAELSDSMAQARSAGRMVVDLPLEAVDAAYLTRDRSHIDAEDMATLMDSLRTRGQQTPIEVVDLGAGRFGLISGFRRLEALRRLQADGGKTDSIQALLRSPADAPAAYVAMVEENEVRANLSFYERARLVVQAARQGVFADEKQALKALFKSAPRAKRSKIGSFVPVVQALDGVLKFPQSLSEKNGLALSKALAADDGLGARLLGVLEQANPTTSGDEWAITDGQISGQKESLKISLETEIALGIYLKSNRGKIELSGPNVTPDLQARLVAWLKAEA